MYFLTTSGVGNPVFPGRVLSRQAPFLLVKKKKRFGLIRAREILFS